MSFVKLDSGILDSTIWLDREAREVFITALLMAVPYELTEPARQMAVKSMEPTGWEAPPGWYGFIHAAGIGIIRRAGVEDEPGLAALERLCSPEESSRSPEFEGRRLARVNGGYLVLNFIRYRDKDHTAATRSRRYRERRKLPLVDKIVARDGRRCGVCGQGIEPASAHVDHIVPLAKGGKDHVDNMQLAHSECNSGKSGGQHGSANRHASMPRVTPWRDGVTRDNTQAEAEAEAYADNPLNPPSATRSHGARPRPENGEPRLKNPDGINTSADLSYWNEGKPPPLDSETANLLKKAVLKPMSEIMKTAEQRKAELRPKDDQPKP